MNTSPGPGIDEIAQAAGVPPATVKRDWDEAKRMLFETLRGTSS